MIREAVPVLVVSDVRMPGADGIQLLRMVRDAYPAVPFLLITAYADAGDAVTALKLGAVDYLAKPVDLDELLAAVRDVVGVRAGYEDLKVPAEAMKGIVAESPAMRAVVKDAYRVVASDANVLITGEGGSGKEVVALFIYHSSPRRDGPMVAVNRAAIPATLLASELFGHERGAFTGAIARRQGRFREAHGGTLLLDEVGDNPLELQGALLSAIETSRVTPVGSDRKVEVDYRLLAATNRDLIQEVEAGRFRRDLYCRLNVIAIEALPLRERPEDILHLARFFLIGSPSQGKRLSRAAAKALTAHNWPGDVREFAKAMEHASLLCPSEVVLPEHLPPAVREAAVRAVMDTHEGARAEGPDLRTLEETETEAIRRALDHSHGKRTKAAQLLGITRRGLIYELKRLGLEWTPVTGLHRSIALSRERISQPPASPYGSSAARTALGPRAAPLTLCDIRYHRVAGIELSAPGTAFVCHRFPSSSEIGLPLGGQERPGGDAMASSARWTMRRLLRTLLVTLAAAGTAAGAAAYYHQRVEGQVPSLRTTQVRRGDLVFSISATGNVEPEEVNDVGAQVAGQIVSFGTDGQGKMVDYGSSVREKTVLAKMDDSIYRAEAAQAQAQVQSAEAGIQPAEADLEQMRAKLSQAERDWSRAQEMGRSEALSQATYDAYKSSYETAVANVAVGEAAVL